MRLQYFSAISLLGFLSRGLSEHSGWSAHLVSSAEDEPTHPTMVALVRGAAADAYLIEAVLTRDAGPVATVVARWESEAPCPTAGRIWSVSATTQAEFEASIAETVKTIIAQG